MKKIPSIKSVMTAFPYSIDVSDTLGRAQEVMAEHTIRHLPATKDGSVVGVISKKDILLYLSKHQDEIEPLVQEVCTPGAYIIDLGERLDRVLLHMAEHHLDCAVVIKGERLAGIFTTADACRCFGDFLRKQFPVGGGGGNIAA